MSFDNNVYPNRKDWIHPYTKKGPKYCRSCRPHGNCEYCKSNRLYRTTKLNESNQEQLKEFKY